MPARNIKRYLAVVAAAAAADLGAVAPAAASASLAAAPASVLAIARGGGAGQVPMHDFHITRLTPAMTEDLTPAARAGAAQDAPGACPLADDEQTTAVRLGRAQRRFPWARSQARCSALRPGAWLRCCARTCQVAGGS